MAPSIVIASLGRPQSLCAIFKCVNFAAVPQRGTPCIFREIKRGYKSSYSKLYSDPLTPSTERSSIRLQYEKDTILRHRYAKCSEETNIRDICTSLPCHVFHYVLWMWRNVPAFRDCQVFLGAYCFLWNVSPSIDMKQLDYYWVDVYKI
jgi:hypothetical protein